MANVVTLRSGCRVHILVPWNAIQHSKRLQEPLQDIRVQNAPAVFVPINRG